MSSTFTRIASKVAFTHIMEFVIGNTNITAALEVVGIDDTFGLMTLTDADVENLIYPDLDPKVTTTYKLKKGEMGLLRCFIHFVYYRDEINDPINNEWNKVTMEKFDVKANTSYTPRFGSISTLTYKLSTPSVPTSTSTSTSTSSHGPSPVDIFKRGIKRDPSVFPTLKDEKLNDQWHRSFANQARAQDLSDVLNITYVPSSPDHIALFEEKQKYLYAVLEARVETAKGKSIIRRYEFTYDAQQAYADLTAHHLKSTKAALSSTKILEYITSAKIGDGSWHGTAENFVLNWQEQVRLYERLVPPIDQFSDGHKRIMLQTAVHPLQELRQVKATAELLRAHHGKDIDYDAYVSLLLSVCSDYDSKNLINKSKRQVYQHDVIESDFYDDYHAPDQFDIDTPVDTIQAFASNFRPRPPRNVMPNRVRMPKDKWFSLDQKTKDLWDQIDDKQKSIILGYEKPTISSNPSNGRPPNRPSFPLPRRNINLHDMSAYDFLQAHVNDSQFQEDPHDTLNDSLDTDEPEPATSDTLLINAATGSRRLIKLTETLLLCCIVSFLETLQPILTSAALPCPWESRRRLASCIQRLIS